MRRAERALRQIIRDHHADVYGMDIHPKRPFFFMSSSRDTTLRFSFFDHLSSPFFIRAMDPTGTKSLLQQEGSERTQVLEGDVSKEVVSAVDVFEGSTAAAKQVRKEGIERR